MGISLRFLRIPRPQSFLYLMSLQTGAALITLSLLLNKISGVYGLLALLTSYQLSPFQLSMYIYSILGLALTAVLAPHVRLQSPLQCLALAWFYLIDSVINAAYTAAFAVTWFLVISQQQSDARPGSSMVAGTAGFTSPTVNVSSDVGSSEDTTSSPQPTSVPARANGVDSSGSASLGNGVLQPESLQSIAIICTLWTIRVYFVFVMLAFARQCILQYAFHARTSVDSRRRTSIHAHNRNPSILSNIDSDPNPFNPRSPEGQGWKGKFGRIMVSVGRSYWLEDDDHSWMNGMNRKFRKSVDPFSTGNNNPGSGISERERRRRSGTGPPLPSNAVVQASMMQQQQQQQQQTHSNNHSRNQSLAGQSVKMYDLSEGR
ncbi:DUF1753 domain-containing protein [Histoplasma capsulatum var. duboisii H88]|uniref:DUF1753 domain-containing protein n=2 Tax=Ajellomyces capsulatus (strain H88) TaxID=544711 RepID=A0A8A1LLA8_AJEC8|nr:DUF1753 domain-containing protein [Histoplasma capsulatum var. duboisii H88]